MIKSHLEQQNFERMKDLQKKNQEQMRDISAQLQSDLQAFLQQSMQQMFNRMAPPQTAPPPPPASTAPHIVSITSVSACRLPPNKRNPWTPSHLKKGVSGVKGSSAIATQSIQAVASNIQVSTSISSSQPSQPPAAAAIPQFQSPFQTLEQEEYGTDTSASSFAASNRSEEPTDPGEQAAPPNLPFRELVQKVREFLCIPDPATEVDYKLGSALGCDPLLLQQKKANRPPSIKLSMVADLSRLQSAQDDLVKPSTSNTLDIGKFPGIQGSWYSVVDNKFAQTPHVVPQAFSNIAKPGYRSGPQFNRKTW